MARAFVVEWDPNIVFTPNVFDTKYFYNQCYFKLQVFDGNPRNAYHCYYETKNAYNGKVLTRLMTAVQKFQLFCFVKNCFPYYFNDFDVNCRIEKMLDYLETLGPTTDDYYDYKDYCNSDLPKTIPFYIHELDSNKDFKFKPSFFAHEYKIHDKKDHPLYLGVILEKNDDADNNNIFNYKIKFIGSGQPLSKLIERVPLCYDQENKKLEQKIEKYHADKKKYYEYIHQGLCEKLMNKEKFKELFKTYTWDSREYKEIDGEEWSRLVTHLHDGETPKKLFRAAFGDEILSLVTGGDFTEKQFGKIPDVSNPKFIKAYNEFAKHAYFLHPLQAFKTFDDNSKDEILHTMKNIVVWAANPNKESVTVRCNNQSYFVPTTRKKEKEQEPAKTTENSVPDMATQLASLKTKLLQNYMLRVKNPAILIKSPGKTKINYVNDQPYMDTNGKEFWDTNVDIWIEYKKTTSKQQQLGYRFTNIDLGYNFCDAIRELYSLQSNPNFKWARSKLFVHNDKVLTEDIDMRFCPSDDIMIKVEKTDTDYNGIKILNPQNMKPIICEHYELYTTGQRFKPTEILLFDKNNAITGIIYAENIDQIIPYIIARNTKEKMK